MAANQNRKFTSEELAEFNGQEGRRAFVAYSGRVFDVTESRLWRNGQHSARHLAGRDLTEMMINAPHDAALLGKFPVVGEIVKEKMHGALTERVERLHPHPIIVHFSEALPILGAFFALVFLVQGDPFFEYVSFISILLSGFSSFGCMASGLFSWMVGYERRFTRVFARKIFLSITLTVMISVLLFWRTFDPDVLTGFGDLAALYLLIVFALVPVTTLLGHYGGKIVYG